MYQLNFFKLFEHKLLAIFGSPIFIPRNETKRHRRGRAAKLSAHGEDAKFYPAASLQIKRHRRMRGIKLSAVEECTE